MTFAVVLTKIGGVVFILFCKKYVMKQTTNWCILLLKSIYVLIQLSLGYIKCTGL